MKRILTGGLTALLITAPFAVTSVSATALGEKILKKKGNQVVATQQTRDTGASSSFDNNGKRKLPSVIDTENRNTFGAGGGGL